MQRERGKVEKTKLRVEEATEERRRKKATSKSTVEEMQSMEAAATALGAFADFTDMFSTNVAFMALDKVSGTAKVSGQAERGGTCDGTVGAYAGFADVFSTNTAFMALDKANGTAK